MLYEKHSKATTLESKFPLLAVEHNLITSKDADITACFRVHLPELFTVASPEYDATSGMAYMIKTRRIIPSSTNRIGTSRKIMHRTLHRMD